MFKTYRYKAMFVMAAGMRGPREVEGGTEETVQPCLNVLQPCYLTY